MSVVEGNRGSTAAARMRVARLRKVLTTWGPLATRGFPWRTCPDPYQRLLAELLLQRTRAAAVATVWPTVTREFGTPRRLATASEEHIAHTVRSLGLARKRAKYLKSFGRALVEHGSVPDDLATLLQLPGIGPYSAAAFLASFGGRTAPVDTNTRRVLGRVVIGVDRADRLLAADLAGRLLARGDPATLLFALLDLSAARCGAATPACAGCIAENFCAFNRASSARSTHRATTLGR